MPDSVSGPYVFTRRKDLADFIKSELELFDMPKSLFREVSISRLWSHITRHGASVAHFSLDHKGYSLSFHGLTEDEANAMDQED